jgi:hypothetical protein
VTAGEAFAHYNRTELLDLLERWNAALVRNGATPRVTIDEASAMTMTALRQVVEGAERHLAAVSELDG